MSISETLDNQEGPRVAEKIEYTDLQRHRFLVEGDATEDDWKFAVGILGRLGLKLTQLDIIRDGYIPYRLDQITSSTQYLSSEHIDEFWPEYYKSCLQDGVNAGSKIGCVSMGINILAYPAKKNKAQHSDKAERARMAESLGFKVVAPRSLAGFSDVQGYSRYGKYRKNDFSDAVIEVGSFISGIKTINEMERRDRPWYVGDQPLRMFMALADTLQRQIDAAPPTTE